MTALIKTALSLFAGAGGMDVGFNNAGIDVRLAVDFNRDACRTYALNHSTAIVQADLKSFELPELAKGIDAVFGGPPCQGFSRAGKLDPKDERNLLIQTFADIVKACAPKVFVCENVPAFETADRCKPVRYEFLERLSKNYQITPLLLNAKDFGVPQNRERVFYVAAHRDVLGLDAREFHNKLVEQLSFFSRPAPTVAEVIRSQGRAGTASNPDTCKAKIVFVKSPILRQSPYAGMLFNGGGRALSPHGLSCTLPATMGGNRTPIIDEGEVFDGEPSYIEAYHRYLRAGGAPHSGNAPSRLRRLTIAECQTLQGFPIDYRFAGSKSSIYRQIGNAVPPPMAEAVALALIRVLAGQKAAEWPLAA